jgi:hypothetical protein
VAADPSKSCSWLCYDDSICKISSGSCDDAKATLAGFSVIWPSNVSATGALSGLESDCMESPTKVSEFDGDLSEFVNDYDCPPKLTPRPDRLEGTELTQEFVNEMVLWKVNRSLSLDHQLLRQLEDLKRLKSGEHRKAKSVLALLLDVSGVDLMMASQVLHFCNPSVLQIIDRHAYRAM